MAWLIAGLIFTELCLLVLLIKIIQGKLVDFFINRIKKQNKKGKNR